MERETESTRQYSCLEAYIEEVQAWIDAHEAQDGFAKKPTLHGHTTFITAGSDNKPVIRIIDSHTGKLIYGPPLPNQPMPKHLLANQYYYLLQPRLLTASTDYPWAE